MKETPAGNTRLVLFGHSAAAFANIVRQKAEKFFIVSLQMSNKIITLSVIFR